MKMILAALFMIWTPAPHGGVAQAMDSIRPLLEEKWKDLARTVLPFHPTQSEMWNYRITVPFPAFWPPARGSPLVYYDVPYGIDPGRLADAELVGDPWARITVQTNRPPRVELLEKKVVKLGTQGVRPITQKEKEIYDSEKAVIGYLAKLSSPPRRFGARGQASSGFLPPLEKPQRGAGRPAHGISPSVFQLADG
jgi:hypothetical protein